MLLDVFVVGSYGFPVFSSPFLALELSQFRGQSPLERGGQIDPRFASCNQQIAANTDVGRTLCDSLVTASQENLPAELAHIICAHSMRIKYAHILDRRR